MSISIATFLYQTNTNAFFTPVEQTVWNFANGGSWSGFGGHATLTMGGSGTSGIVRFASANGETFAVVLGVHNGLRWCDIVVDIPNTQTATTIHPLYYTENTPQTTQREKQLASCKATAKNGRNINVNYTVPLGFSLSTNIVIS